MHQLSMQMNTMAAIYFALDGGDLTPVGARPRIRV